MPLEELEIHPYLNLGQAIANPSKLILGSFPVYEVTDPATIHKEQRRIHENSTRFFYGSCDSGFWNLYSLYVDNRIILPPNIPLILESLSERCIALSDVILSCQRHEFSSEDSKLIRRTYNKLGVRYLINQGVRKILCTSKGALKNLEKNISCPVNDPIANLNIPASLMLQNYLMDLCGGSSQYITEPIAKVFNYNGFVIEAVAIPSPGSPQRQLKQFGFDGTDWQTYADEYFANSFTWLLFQ